MQNYMSNGQIPYNNGNSVPQQPQYVQGTVTNPAPNPNYAGVNIQIINPMVNPVGTNGYIYPQQTISAYSAGTNGGCYPSSYYTTQPGGYVIPQQNPYGHIPSQQTASVNGTQEYPTPQPAGFYDQAGNYYPYVKDGEGNVGYYDKNGQFHKLDSGIQTGESNEKGTPENGKGEIPTTNNSNDTQTDNANKEQVSQNKAGTESGTIDNSQKTDDNNNVQNADNNNGFYDKDGKFHEYTKDENGNIGYKDDNGQFHKLEPNDPNYPKDDKSEVSNTDNQKNSGSNTNNSSTEKTSETIKEKTEEQKKSGGKTTETRTVVALTNDYIKTLENYLDSQDLEVRKMGAHEVVERIMEDPSRKDDPALTALVNKMLQDPSSGIRAIALSIVESRALSGDNLTVKLLKDMQKNKDEFGLDATQATNALLKMAGKTVEKEIEVPKDRQKTEKENEKQVK